MKRRFVGAFVLALTLCAAVALSGCAQVQFILQPEAYEPEAPTPTVDTPTIGQSGTLRVAIDADDVPFAGASDGKPVGYNVDVAAALASKLGLKLELVDVGDSGAAEALSSGKADIAMGMATSSPADGVWLSAPYAKSGVTLFAKPGSTTVPTADSSPSIAAQVSSRSAWAVENLFGEASVVAATNLQSAFSSLSNGDADYVAADAVIGTYAAHTSKVDVALIAMLEEPSGYCIGVPSSNANLQSAVTDALSSLDSGGVLGLISNKWLGSTTDLSSLPVVASTGAKSTKSNEALLNDSASTAGSNAVIQGQTKGR